MRSNGIRLNWKSPSDVEKAVFSRDVFSRVFSSTSICQYPLKRSRRVKKAAPDIASRISSHLDNG